MSILIGMGTLAAIAASPDLTGSWSSLGESTTLEVSADGGFVWKGRSIIKKPCELRGTLLATDDARGRC